MIQKNATDLFNPFGDLNKLIEQFKIPGVDVKALVESRRKDLEALQATNKSVLDSMQELAKRQAEVLRQAMLSVQDLAKDGQKSLDPAKQLELASRTYEKAVAEMNELASMARKAQTDALIAIGKRAQKSVEEMKEFGRPK